MLSKGKTFARVLQRNNISIGGKMAIWPRFDQRCKKVVALLQKVAKMSMIPHLLFTYGILFLIQGGSSMDHKKGRQHLDEWQKEMNGDADGHHRVIMRVDRLPSDFQT